MIFLKRENCATSHYKKKSHFEDIVRKYAYPFDFNVNFVGR